MLLITDKQNIHIYRIIIIKGSFIKTNVGTTFKYDIPKCKTLNLFQYAQFYRETIFYQ